VIFSLQRLLSGGTKLTRNYADKLGKLLLHVYDTWKARILHPDSPRVENSSLDRSSFAQIKQARNPECNQPSGIEGARRSRVDICYIALLR
jgi:hypothetical protein